MIVGIPKEVKKDEYRISLTPDKVDLLVRSGHTVLVEAGAGEGAAFKDQEYEAVGGTLVRCAQEVFDQADMVVKVKEPQPSEFDLLHEDQVLFTYLHLAPEPEITQMLLSRTVAGIAYETVQEKDGGLPLLYPMSEIAGKLATQIAARLLEKPFGGPGKLLGGVPGTEACQVVVVGGGTVGLNAALTARALGGSVTIVDVDLDRLRYIDHTCRREIRTIFSTPANLSSLVARADVVVGAVLVPGALAPKLITKEMIAAMREQCIVIDVSIDQGGSVEGIHSTVASSPSYMEDGIIYSAIPNIPGMVANTSSISLSNATFPYALRLASKGLDAVRADEGFGLGVNTLRGHVTHPAVAESLGLEYVPLKEALAA